MLNRTDRIGPFASPKRAGPFVPALMAAMLLVVGVGDAIACTCALSRTGPSCGDFVATQAVFTGEVVAIEPATDARLGTGLGMRRVTLRVIEPFGGIQGPDVEVLTAESSSMCGYPFAKGSRYLVYGFRGRDGALTTSICSRTKPLANIGGELRQLRSVARPATTRVTGRVRLHDYDYGTGATPFRPLARARFVLSGAGRYEAVSERDGTFALDVTPGRYDVELLLPDGLYAPRLPRELDLTDTRGCPHVEVSAQHDGHVTGRVVTSDGEPVADLQIELTRTDRRATVFGGRTNAQGEFDIERVAPGRFLLALASEPRIWLPTPAPGDDPTPLLLPPSARVAMGDLVLHAGIRFTTITGRVVDASGDPIAGASVSAQPVDGKTGGGPPIVTDASGAFAVAVVAGPDYRIAVNLQDGWGRPVPHSTTTVSTATSQAPLVLRPIVRRP